MNCANHPERERVSFCQSCGKPLCGECTRVVGAGVFCEPCLAARLAAADAGIPHYSAVPGSGAPPVPGTPNPGLAALLGLIPGVGAMYNGQYAKGVVHLIVFAVLVSLADAHGAFGILVAGWVFYQIFEAYHTARARRDGTPLPNPFGLNDVGERFGFGKAWPTAAGASSQGGATPAAPFGEVPNSAAAPNWSAPAYTYAEAPVPPVPPYGPPMPPFTESYPSSYTDIPAQPANRFPAGAIWLIALGLLFFFGSSGFLVHFPIQRLIPFLLISLGVWLFFHKMTSAGQSLMDDGSPGYRLRIFRALRGAVWLILVGVLFFMDSFYILSWERSWPLFIIVAGLMGIAERSAYNAAAPIPFGNPLAHTAAQQPSAPSSVASTSIVPRSQHDQEGQ